MSIPVVCPSCHANFSVPDKAAGAKGKCRSCGAVIHVPVPAASIHANGGSLANEIPLAPESAPPPPLSFAAATKRPPESEKNRTSTASDIGLAAKDKAKSLFKSLTQFTQDRFAEPAVQTTTGEKSPVAESPVAVPDYKGLTWAASFFRNMYLLNIIAAVLTLIGGVIYAFQEQSGREFVHGEIVVSEHTPGMAGFMLYFGYACGIIFTALVFLAISHAITAFRDIARNSWITAFGRHSRGDSIGTNESQGPVAV